MSQTILRIVIIFISSLSRLQGPEHSVPAKKVEPVYEVQIPCQLWG